MRVERIECRLKITPPHINLSGTAMEVGKKVDEMFDHRKFDIAIRYLQDEGIPATAICAEIGIPRICLYAWRNGTKRPTDPYYLLMVREWARLIKENREKCEREFSAHQPGSYLQLS